MCRSVLLVCIWVCCLVSLNVDICFVMLFLRFGLNVMGRLLVVVE